VKLRIMDEDSSATEKTISDASASSAPLDNEDFTTQTLRFLSSASNETLGGIAMGLAACTYLVLGRIGLVLMGALGGVVLHATWERHSMGYLVGTAEDTRREKGLDIMKRVLDWQGQRKVKEEAEELDDTVITGRAFEGFRPETATALNEFVDAVIRDYVKWWYTPILPNDNSFPMACRQTLTNFLSSVSSHLYRKRPADTFLDFLTNSTSIIIVFLNELSSAITASGGNGSPAEAVYAYLSTNPESNLANVLSERQQKKKFKMVADDILQNFLEKSTYRCDPAKAFLREIMAGVVLEMTLKNCSKPEWINAWIVHLLEAGEPEIIHAIDVGMGATPADDIDGNVGNIGLAKSKSSIDVEKVNEMERKKKRLSAEAAMEEAMAEAKRLSKLMVDEDAKRALSQEEAAAEDDIEPSTPKKIQSTSNSEPFGPLHGNGQRSSVHSSPKSPKDTEKRPFTSFDQIVPRTQPTVPTSSSTPVVRPLTLHNANIIIYDDSTASDKGRIRSKPTGDYLVQIEPEASQYPGWMIVRKYPDFETLHEVLRRIASISGVTSFTEQHSTLPNWKGHTKASLRGELERYLRDACWYQPLAESEGMKRFLEKDQQNQTPGSKGGFPGLGWTPNALENVGKGMLDALTSAPKGAAEGGKAVIEGVTGVFGGISLGPKKASPPNGSGPNNAGRSSTMLSRVNSVTSTSSSRKGRDSEESLRIVSSPPSVTQSAKFPSTERRPSYNSIAEADSGDEAKAPSISGGSSVSGRSSTTHSRDPSRGPKPRLGASPMRNKGAEDIRLPPLPADIPDDYQPEDCDPSTPRSTMDGFAATARTSMSTAPSHSPGRPSISASRRASMIPTTPARVRRASAPLSEQETSVAVELLFAVINELYTLSSAWNIRRTLLNAAKSFLLRPGNPSLASIQTLIQESVIAANTSDAGIATNLRKIRENTLPTEEELKLWPAEMSAEDKERLRVKARKLLIERGVPAALTGVMGQAATGEALGRVFDCLQVEEVARGLMFGLILQGVRAVTN
jgi:hypothetical protein